MEKKRFRSAFAGFSGFSVSAPTTPRAVAASVAPVRKSATPALKVAAVKPAHETVADIRQAEAA